MLYSRTVVDSYTPVTVMFEFAVKLNSAEKIIAAQLNSKSEGKGKIVFEKQNKLSYYLRLGTKSFSYRTVSKK